MKNGSCSKNRMWLKLDKCFFGRTKDLYICAAYIPPVSSPDYEDDCFELENEISKFSAIGEIILAGDLNSITGNVPDYVINDDNP